MRTRAMLFAAMGVTLPRAGATYSIAACDALTKACGVAVQTNNLAVGSSVPYAKAGVGAIASQFETNPAYGPQGLALLEAGKNPEATLRQLLHDDGNFGGDGINARQVGIAAADGASANFTGDQAASAAWAGARKGKGYSVQGNGLAGPRVVEQMESAFVASSGSLADRLLAALAAGDAAGGQRTGRESAALLVRTMNGFPFDVDLRVDHAADPVADLRGLYGMWAARQQVVDAGVAAQQGSFEKARSLLIAATGLAPSWPRVWIRAARVAIQIEEPQLALQYLTVAFSENPEWARAEIGDGLYAALGANPLFHRWVSADMQEESLAALRATPATVTEAGRILLAKKLLEAGHAREGAQVLSQLTPKAGEPADLSLLRASALAANGDSRGAIAQCKAVLGRIPGDFRARARLAQIQSGAEQ